MCRHPAFGTNSTRLGFRPKDSLWRAFCFGFPVKGWRSAPFDPAQDKLELAYYSYCVKKAYGKLALFFQMDRPEKLRIY